MKEERRRQPRYPLDKLKVHLRMRRGLFNHEWVSVKPIDYSRSGVGFKTDEVLGVGDSVMISIRLVLEFGDVVIDEAPSIVRHAEKECSCFNYGVQFDLESRRMKREEVQQGLVRIESLLERYKGIQERMREHTPRGH